MFIDPLFLDQYIIGSTTLTLFTPWVMSQDDTQNTPHYSTSNPSLVLIIPAHKKLQIEGRSITYDTT